jgi:cysteine desulfurase/selenocysteine lyase
MWLQQFSWTDIEKQEEQTLKVAIEKLSAIDGLKFLATKNVSGCVSFTIDGVHPHDLTDMLGEKNIHLRAGHHCTQPLHKKLGIAASTRLAVGIYNSIEEIDALAKEIQFARERLT